MSPDHWCLLYIFNCIEKIKCPHLKSYLDVIFSDKQLVSKLVHTPYSADKLSSMGGLVIYTAGVLKEIEKIIDDYPTGVDQDILITSAIVHVLGGIFAFEITSGDNGQIISPTPAKNLLGKAALSYSFSIQTFILVESITKQAVPEDIKDRIHHCILRAGGLPTDLWITESEILCRAIKEYLTNVN